jgi:hypothetical protein
MWKLGRQNSGYFKFTFFQFSFADCHLLKYPTGSEIKPHVDEVDGKKHYRLNIVLRKAKVGGVFSCEKSIINFPRVKLFRPDLYEHSVSKIEDGERLVLSFGVAI